MAKSRKPTEHEERVWKKEFADHIQTLRTLEKKDSPEFKAQVERFQRWMKIAGYKITRQGVRMEG